MTTPQERIERIFRDAVDSFKSDSPDELEVSKTGETRAYFGRGKKAFRAGVHALLLNNEWRNWFAKSARYRLRGLELFEQENGTLRAVEYDQALCGAILSEHDDVIEEVVAAIQEMPDEIHSLGNVHGEVVRDTLRCQAALIEGDHDTTEEKLAHARETFEAAAAENGLELVENDRTDRFPATFQFIQGVLDDDSDAIEDAIDQLLVWHERELFADGTSDYFAHWPAMYIVLAEHFGYTIRPDHEYLPEHFLNAIGQW